MYFVYEKKKEKILSLRFETMKIIIANDRRISRLAELLLRIIFCG